MTRILASPLPEHRCNIGSKLLTITQEEADAWNAESHHMLPPSMAGTFIIDDLELRALPGGSVVKCEVCGKVWVKNAVEWKCDARAAWIVDNSWRPEKRRERRKRERHP